MKTVEKKVVQSHGADRAPLCGFITYIDPRKPVLLRRIGWEVSNDIHDDFADAVSTDNGRTWSDLRPALSSIPVEGGVVVHTENAALYLPDRNLLVHWTNDKFESSLKAGSDLGIGHRIRITVGDPDSVSRNMVPSPLVSDFGIKQGPCVSFSTPLLDSRGRVLLPIQWQKKVDPRHPIPASAAPADYSSEASIRGGPIHGRGFPTRRDMPDVFEDFWEAGLLIGEFQPDGKLAWHVSAGISCDFAMSSRGLYEGTVAELADGRFFMILRGSNAEWPEKPGYKWLAFSRDRGESWSEPKPLACDDGSLIESSSTGSVLFRSAAGKLYWLGNLCLEGRRPQGNMPRSPIYIAEMQEDPVAIKRKTITVIDRAQPGEDPDTQHSNFKVYQDRVTGDVVLHFTRYGERGYANNAWIRADLYQYRVALED